MSPAQWQQIKQIFWDALQLETAERMAFLTVACGEDRSVRREVDLLLAEAERISIVKGVEVDVPVRLEPENPGFPQIGAYQCLKEIGAGGMGKVYLAQRAGGYFKQQVAIKVIRPGMDSERVVQRFRNERQILASLNHPNIAKLFDGGVTDEGLPFFVMEVIAGTPLDAYCNQRKLSVTSRLELFRPICAAVEYAHRNLVVHRDLKPGNILVTDEGVPKLLDFGIAKVLHAAGPTDEGRLAAMTLTQPGEWVFTPAYASPEQLRGAPITTASDVYSLGVVLFKLLTGVLPFRLEERRDVDLIQIICTEEPTRPSTAIEPPGKTGRFSEVTTMPTAPAFVSREENTVEKHRRRLRGDLDTIILKALSKEPERRYASVERFSEDIRRYLEGWPILARPDSFRYRTGKFVRRNRLAVTFSALLLLLLLGAGSVMTWQGYKLRIEQEKSARRFVELRKLARSYIFEIHDGIKDLPGSTATRKVLVERALEYLNRLAAEANDDIDLQCELAEAYQQIGTIQGIPYQPNLGDRHGARDSFGKSIAILEKLLAAHPQDSRIKRDLALSYQQTNWLLDDGADFWQALQPAVNLREELAAANPNNLEDRLALARVYHILGTCALNRPLQELEAYRKAQAVLASFPADRQADGAVRKLTWYVRSAIADVLIYRLGKPLRLRRLEAQATQNLFQQGMALHEANRIEAVKVAQMAANSASAQRVALGCTNDAGGGYLWAGDLTGARERLQFAHDGALRLSQSDPANIGLKDDVLNPIRSLIDVARQQGHQAEAQALLTQAGVIWDGLNQPGIESTEQNLYKAFRYADFGKLWLEVGNQREALRYFREALRRYEASPHQRQGRIELAEGTAQLVAAAPPQLKPEAQGFLAQIMTFLKQDASRREADLAAMDETAWVLLTCTEKSWRDPQLARSLAERVVQLAPQNPVFRFTLARAYEETGDHARALETTRQAEQMLPLRKD